MNLRCAVIITLIASVVNATEFICTVTDSAGLPIDSVKAVFTFDYQVQPPVYTDSSGRFSTTAPFDGKTSIQLVLSKNGYRENKMDFGSRIQATNTFIMKTSMFRLVDAIVTFRSEGFRRVTLKPSGGVQNGNDAVTAFTLDGRALSGNCGFSRSDVEKRGYASQIIIGKNGAWGRKVYIRK
jgi:hypothetical protein